MQSETERQAEIKTRIAELRANYLRLTKNCSYGAKVNRDTVEEYARKLETLQAKLG